MKHILLATICATSVSCSAVWHNPANPFVAKPVKCSDNWVPTTLDAAGFSFAGMNALYAKNDGSPRRKEQEDRVIWWLMISSVYFTSAYMGFAEVYHCEVSSGEKSLLKN